MNHPITSYDYFCRTDQGRTRANNEDSVLVSPGIGLAVLADGMGGYNAGEVASAMATSLIVEELGRWLSSAGDQVPARDVRRAMEACVASVNRAIFEAAQSNPHHSGMGTTLVMGVFQGARLMVGHIGDSRAYRLRDGNLIRVTRDHSLMQEQIDAGLITPQQAAVSAHRNLVTRALGVEPSVLLEVNEHRVEPGDCYLLCSDGLSDMVDDATIGRLLGEGGPIQGRGDALIDQANANGGRDNVSVLIARAGGEVPRRGLLARWLGK